MAEPFIGQVVAYGFNFPPLAWATCSGQLMSIAQNTALFTLIGTTYGGDGVTTFALPDLRGRASLSFGQGPNLSNYIQGQAAGSEMVTLIGTENPVHTHGAATANTAGTVNTPASNVILSNQGPGSPPVFAYAAFDATKQVAISPSTIVSSGTSLPHENRQPYLALNYCIALEGIFPSQN